MQLLKKGNYTDSCNRDRGKKRNRNGDEKSISVLIQGDIKNRLAFVHTVPPVQQVSGSLRLERDEAEHTSHGETDISFSACSSAASTILSCDIISLRATGNVYIHVRTTSFQWELERFLQHSSFVNDWADSAHSTISCNTSQTLWSASVAYSQQCHSRQYTFTACTVVQAVVKANSQSNGNGQISTPRGSKTP